MKTAAYTIVRTLIILMLVASVIAPTALSSINLEKAQKNVEYTFSEKAEREETEKSAIFPLSASAISAETCGGIENLFFREVDHMYFPQQPFFGMGAMNPMSNPYGGWICDQLFVNPSLCIAPRTITYSLTSRVEKKKEARQLSKRGNAYFIKERDQREVFVGKLNIIHAVYVNPRPDNSFDALYCQLECGEEMKRYSIAIPYRHLVGRSILPFLQHFPRSPDCPDRYIVMAFYEELQRFSEMRFLVLPDESGWQAKEGKFYFSSASSVIGELEQFYPADILRRKLIPAAPPLADAAKNLAAVLPADWRYKALLSVSTASVMLLPFAEADYKPDGIIITVPECDQNAITATALLSTTDYRSTATCSLLSCQTALENELDNMVDGTVVFRDASLLEDRKRRNTGIDILIQDLKRGLGISESKRHLIAVIPDNLSFLPSDFPAFYLNLGGCPEIEDIRGLQQAVGAFHTALINLIANSSAERNLITEAIQKTKPFADSIRNSDSWMIKSMIRAALQLLQDYGLVSSTENEEITAFLKSGTTQASDANLAIADEFCAVLSDAVVSGRLRLMSQYGGPYFDEAPSSAFCDERFLNFTEASLDWTIAPMTTTKRRTAVLAALKECGLLNCSNFFKRIVEVEIAAGHSKRINAYSVPKSVLTPQALAKVTALFFGEFLLEQKCFPNGFVPLLTVVDGKAAGRLISEQTDEAEGVFVSGQARSGKTFFLVQQAVIRAASGFLVVIFDQTGAFTFHELRKHLPEEIIAHYFALWDLGEQGLPVDLLSLEQCKGLRDKKDRLENVLSVLARLTGDVQSKTLRSRLARVSRAIETDQLHGLSDVLRFFDEDDPDQTEIRDRLAEAFEDLEGLPESKMSWDEFLEAQGRIVVISTGSDNIHKSPQFIDATLASLFAWKQHHRDERMTVILGEISDLCLETKGPIGTILRKGGKNRLAMMVATQQFSAEKNLLGEIVGNCGLKVFFRSKDADLREVSKRTGIEQKQLAALEQGECIALGGFYSQRNEKNLTATLHGRSYSAAAFLAPAEQPVEAQVAADEASDPSFDEAFNLPEEGLSEALDLTEIPMNPGEPESEPSALEKQQSPETDNDEAEAGLSETMEPESVVPPAQDPPEGELADVIPETEEQPKPPEAEPEENPQERIEAELQQQFQELKRKFNPDYPCWSSYLTEFFTAFLERHHFADAIERDRMEERLESFLHVSTEQYRYADLLNNLFSELWPTG